jgi:hypothetical protein
MKHRLDTVASTHGAGVKSTRALLARGPGWSVSDVVFRAASERSRFEARHEGIVIAAVTAGNFGYRSSRGRVTLMPGALLLGNADDAFEGRWGTAASRSTTPSNVSKTRSVLYRERGSSPFRSIGCRRRRPSSRARLPLRRHRPSRMRRNLKSSRFAWRATLFRPLPARRRQACRRAVATRFASSTRCT